VPFCKFVTSFSSGPETAFYRETRQTVKDGRGTWNFARLPFFHETTAPFGTTTGWK
jgi:hypothetical protein